MDFCLTFQNNIDSILSTRTNNVCESLNKILKELMKQLDLAIDWAIEELHKRLKSFVNQNVRWNKEMDRSTKARRDRRKSKLLLYV